MHIQTLPPEVVDQIAAGEVVERPAHMVKELVENSLDAGATEIEVDFDQGGRWVKVKDNGVGIAQEELSLAVCRHATSKIRLSSDIWHLSSYGFRGEALATISAVSRVQLLSRPKNQDLAGILSVEFGRVEAPLAQGGDYGTTITISDLFANVPARLKFLKSEAAETTHIKQVLKGLALANPQASFRLRQKGKLISFWPAQSDFQSRVEQVLDLSPLFSAKGTGDGFEVEVIVAPPHVVERSSRQIWILVQGRLVQDRGLQAAVTEAFRHLLMHGEYPIAVVNLRCEPEMVDINIHPTKSAIKFQQPSQAFRVVTRAVRQLLETAPWLPGVGNTSPAKDIPQREIVAQPGVGGQVDMITRDPEFRRTQYAQRLSQFDLTLNQLRELAPQNKVAGVREREIDFETDLDQKTASKGVESQKESDHGTYWQSLQVLGQAHQTYIVAQSADGLILVDQHAAHERVAFERLMSAWKGGTIDIQSYLLPLTITLEPSQVESLMLVMDDFAKLGIQLEASGPQTVAVRSAPSILSEAALAKAIVKVAEEVTELGGSFALEKVVGDICATLACHSVVRAGQPLSREQMQELLEQMDEFPLSSFCPHGRPVSVDLGWSRLEREFGRTV